VPVLPALAQELRTHLNGRRHGYVFETNRNNRYSVDHAICREIGGTGGRHREARLSPFPAALDRDDPTGFRGSAYRSGTKVPPAFATRGDTDLRGNQHTSAGEKTTIARSDSAVGNDLLIESHPDAGIWSDSPSRQFNDYHSE
jgi:hypothetical protein